MQSKERKAIQKIKKKMNEHFHRVAFCNEHNMKLDEMKHLEIAQTLSELKLEIEHIFEITISQ